MENVIKNNIRNDKLIIWQKAAIIGSLWASIEIILGSFLHNMKIPFTGTILASIGVFILTTASGYWNDRGLVIRVGIICALMKSISPSAIIFGPMLGIFLEALIFELVTIIIGRNIIGFMVAGGLAVSCNLLQKIINLFIVYGFDLIKIFNNIFELAVNNFGNPGFTPLEIIIFLFIMDFIFGFFAAFLAITVKRNESIKYINIDKKAVEINNFLSQAVSKTSITMLMVNILIIVSMLFSFKYLQVHYSAVLVALYLFYGYKLYSIKSLSKPRYLFEFAVIILFSGFLSFDQNESQWWLNKSGIYSGMEMVFRASILITGFAILSKELRNPVIMGWVFKRKLKRLFYGMELAFSTLPIMINAISNKKESIRKPAKTIAYLLSIADYLIKKEISDKKIFIISGDINSGKTTFLKKIISELGKKDVKIGGITTESIVSDKTKIGYDLVSLKTNDKSPFLILSENDSVRKEYDKINRIGKFSVLNEGFEFGKKSLIDAVQEKSDIIIIDEVGPAELEGRIWSDSIRTVMESEIKVFIFVVREKIVESICKEFNIFPQNIFYPDDDINASADNIFHKIIPKENDFENKHLAHNK